MMSCSLLAFSQGLNVVVGAAVVVANGHGGSVVVVVVVVAGKGHGVGNGIGWPFSGTVFPYNKYFSSIYFRPMYVVLPTGLGSLMLLLLQVANAVINES